jgi:hypothetical protein
MGVRIASNGTTIQLLDSLGNSKEKHQASNMIFSTKTGVHDAASFHCSLKHIGPSSTDLRQQSVQSNSHHDTSSHQYSTGPKRDEGSK